MYTMTVTALVPSCVNSTLTLDRVRTRVVTIVVRELLFLVMLVICVCGSEVTGQRLRQFLTTFVQIFVYNCFLIGVDSQYYFHIVT